MSPSETLASLPGFAFAFALVMARVAGTVVVLPGLAETGVPAPVRAGLALGIVLLLLPGLAPTLPLQPGSAVVTFAMIGAEAITGLWLGLTVRLLVQALPTAAQVIAYMVGLSTALQQDPELGPQTSVLARLAGLGAPLLLLVSGLYAWPLAALAGSYKVIAAGTLLPAGDATQMMVQTMIQSFALALRLAAPFILASTVWHVAVGLLARLVPRMQVYFVTHPAQVLGGVLLLAVLGSGMLGAWQAAMRDGFGHLPGLG